MKRKPAPRRRVRAPDATRQRLLMAAFQEIYRHGFRAASLDIILSRAGVTKGALYHHFDDKAGLGYAVVDEILKGFVLERWLGRLQTPEGDPLHALQATFRERAASVTDDEVVLGCPLNNLAQEMSPVDPQFRRRIEAAFSAWRNGFARAIARAQKAGTVRKDVNPRKVAAFLVAAAEGAFGTSKSAGSHAMLRANFEMVASYLDTIRVQPDRRRKT